MESRKMRSLSSERENLITKDYKSVTRTFDTSLFLTDINGIPEMVPTRADLSEDTGIPSGGTLSKFGNENGKVPRGHRMTNASPAHVEHQQTPTIKYVEWESAKEVEPAEFVLEPLKPPEHLQLDEAHILSHTTEDFVHHVIPADPETYEEVDDGEYEVVVVGQGPPDLHLPEVHYRAPPTFAEAVISGSVAAVCETLSLHWTTAKRFREQLKAPRSTDLRVLYNSLLPDLISMIPITIAQVFFDSMLRNAMGSRDLSTPQLMFAAAGAGFIASPFPSYAEMIMLMQQKHSIPFRQAINFHYSKLGWRGIFRGLPVCSIRDSVYTTAYLGFAPWLNETCRKRFSENPTLVKFNHWLPFVIAGPTGGLAAGIVTQPLDCIKSRQQASLEKKSVFEASREIWREDGYRGFFTGMKGRLQRVSFGVIVLSFVNDKIQRWLRRHY